MKRQVVVWTACCVVMVTAVAGWAASPALTLERVTQMSDRIVAVTMLGPGNGTEHLPNGTTVPLGVRDPETRLVYTPWRVRVDACLYDREGSCSTGEAKVHLPGGTIRELVHGIPKLRTWEITGAASAPLPPPGEGAVLFLARLPGGAYRPLNDASARLPIDRSTGTPHVRIRVGRSVHLPERSRESDRTTPALPSGPARAALEERVSLERLRELIALARPRAFAPTAEP